MASLFDRVTTREHSGSGSDHRPQALAGTLAVIADLVLVIGLSLVDYRAAVLAILGVLAGSVVYALLGRAVQLYTALVTSMIALVIAGASIHFVKIGELGGGGGSAILGYNATIQPLRRDDWLLLEMVTVQYISGPRSVTRTVNLPRRVVHSHSQGFFLRTVQFTPLKPFTADDPFGTHASLPLPGGHRVDVSVCSFMCNSAYVSVSNLQPNEFYQADAPEVQVTPYLQNEVANWQISSLNHPISFAYYSSPWRDLHGLLSPFAAITSLNDLVTVALGNLSVPLVIGVMLGLIRRRGAGGDRSAGPGTGESSPANVERPDDSHSTSRSRRRKRSSSGGKKRKMA